MTPLLKYTLVFLVSVTLSFLVLTLFNGLTWDFEAKLSFVLLVVILTVAGSLIVYED